MAKKREEVERTCPHTRDPVLDGQCADAEIVGDRLGALAVPNPRDGDEHDFSTRDLAWQYVVRQDALSAATAQAYGQGDGNHPKPLPGMELARYAAAREPRTRGRATGTPTRCELLLYPTGICQVSFVLARVDFEYVSHVLGRRPRV